MEDYEHAYLLDELQLYGLLSALDSRPIMGFMTREAPDKSDEAWNQVLFSLVKNGWLRPLENGYELSAERAALLQPIKDAFRMLAILFKGEDSPMRSLYLGQPSVVVEPYGSGYFRVYALKKDPLIWLEEAQAFPEHMLEEADVPIMMRAFPKLCSTLKELEQDALPVTAAALDWGRLDEVHAVLDLYDNIKAKIICRWVFWSLPTHSVILRQDDNDCTSALDTYERRREIFASFETEENINAFD